MKRKVFIVIVGILLCNYVDFAHAQTLTKYAKQRNQELAQRQKMEKSNYEKACNEGSLAAYNEYLSMYPRGKYVQDVKSRIATIERKAEQECYDNACKKETVQSYKDYISKYPNGQYVQEAKGRIEDMELWQKAKSINTIAAYRYYLSNSNSQSFSQYANDAITELESKDAWNLIRHSSSKTEIESFILKYPKSSCTTDAVKRHDELLAIEFYEQGNLQRAYDKFEEAGGKYSIEPSNRSKYDECVEFVDFKKLNSSSKERDLLAFLKKYPTSKYYKQVSNMVAIEKAKNFSMFSTTVLFNEALSYAKDNTTRNTVQGYIDEAKRSYRKYNSRQRHNRIMANGGYVKFGLELIDIGVSGFSPSYDDNGEEGTFYYNMGLGVKFGNYKAPIQFEIGIKPGVVHTKYYIRKYNETIYGHSYSYDIHDTETFFHMPLYAKMKLNIISAGDSKFYIAGLGTYNAIRKEDYENEFSVGGGVGFAWKKWDWFCLYYKQDVENKHNIDDKFIGSSLVYYF